MLKPWLNLARELASLGATVVILARCKLDDRVSARKIARLTEIVDAQLAQTDADLCDEASMLILDIEEMLAEEREIDQLEAQFRQPCVPQRAGVVPHRTFNRGHKGGPKLVGAYDPCHGLPVAEPSPPVVNGTPAFVEGVGVPPNVRARRVRARYLSNGRAA